MRKDKQSIRQDIIQRRKQLTKKQQSEHSAKMAQWLSQHNIFTKAKRIAYYLPVFGEADPTYLLKDLSDQEKEFYLPIVIHEGGIRLLFAKTDSQTKYKKNQYKINEPIYTDKDLLPAQKLDLVIMPLVGFDHNGSRLGMGGGYYDRTFSFKNELSSRKPFLMGYAYDFQYVEGLQTEHWDIPLNGVVTESTLEVFKING